MATASCTLSMYSSTDSLSFGEFHTAIGSCCHSPNVWSMHLNISSSGIVIPPGNEWAHLPEYPCKLPKIWGHMLTSSCWSIHPWTSNYQISYVTSTLASVALNTGRFSRARASLLSGLQCLLCLQSPSDSLMVDWPSESIPPGCSGEEGGEPPPPSFLGCLGLGGGSTAFLN